MEFDPVVAHYLRGFAELFKSLPKDEALTLTEEPPQPPDILEKINEAI